MQCPHCNATLDDDTVYCGNCGRQILPLHGEETAISYSAQSEGNNLIPSDRGYSSQRPVPQTSEVQARRYAPVPDKPRQVDTPTLQSQSQSQPGNFRRIALIAALILLIVAGGTLGLIALLKNNNTAGIVASHATGQVAFIDSQNGTGHTDALKIVISGLGTPPAGSKYDAWFVNDQSEQAIALGTLVEKDGKFSLSYAGDGQNGQVGTNLLGTGDKLEITLEQGNVKLPTGKVILASTFPPKAFVHIKHLLFSFPTTPGKVGLLVGLLDQTQLLSAQAVILQNAVANRDPNTIQCMAQSIIDIIEGTQGAHYQPLPGVCANQNSAAVGDGFGLLGTNAYISTASQHASLAATQTDTTDNIRSFAGLVETAMNNINGWVTTVEQDALELHNNPGNTTKVQQIVTLSDQAFHGVATNGEAGAITGYEEGQSMAVLLLVPVA